MPPLDADLTEKFTQFVMQYYLNGEMPAEICLPEELDTDSVRQCFSAIEGSDKTELTFPKIGQRKKLVDTAKANSLDYLTKNREKNKREQDMTAARQNALPKS